MSDTGISLVKAIQDYFTKQPNGRKVEIPEFKSLTNQDKADFYHMLKDEYNINLTDEQKSYIK